MIRPTPKVLVVATLAVVGLTLTACGAGSDDSSTAAPGIRTVKIEMRDIAFAPNKVSVRPGETVRFVFHNSGKVTHDAFIGDEKAQDDHEMEMRQTGSSDMSDMKHGGTSDEGGVTVEPGKSGEITHTFRPGDNAMIGCHQVGHYAAGMKIMIDVS